MEFITDESLKQKMIAKGKYIDASLVKLTCKYCRFSR